MNKSRSGRHTTAEWLNGLNSQPVFSTQRLGTESGEETKRLLTSDTPKKASAAVPAPSAAVEAPRSFGQQVVFEIKGFFLDTKLNVLLVFLPIAFTSQLAGWGAAPTFILSMLALCPLAERLGYITEQLAMYTNDTLGGLLNASFGNATEVIISGFALKQGYRRMVQLSLLGSVVSNLLLVMGSAFIAGGIKNPMQHFNQQGINVNCGLLLLSVVAVVLPSLLSETHTEVKDDSSELALSRAESVFLLLCYGLYLLFQLYTHRFLYEEDGKTSDSGKKELDSLVGASPESSVTVGMTTGAQAPAGSVVELIKRSRSGREGGSSREVNDVEIAADGQVGASSSNHVGEGARAAGTEAGSDDDEEEEQVLSKTGCFVSLTLVTIGIAVLSEWIVDAITDASRELKVPMPFLTAILLPIVGNAAEHASAIVFAFKNRIEIALGVAVGSSTQVAVLVVPFCVVLAWMMGEPLDLNFNAFEASVYFLSILLAVVVVQDGTSNWLKGVLLLLTYFFVAAGFWMHKDPMLEDENQDSR